jgi:hypothetical protein
MSMTPATVISRLNRELALAEGELAPSEDEQDNADDNDDRRDRETQGASGSRMDDGPPRLISATCCSVIAISPGP